MIILTDIDKLSYSEVKCDMHAIKGLTVDDKTLAVWDDTKVSYSMTNILFG